MPLSQLVNFPTEVKEQIYKLSSINLCPNTSAMGMDGQADGCQCHTSIAPYSFCPILSSPTGGQIAMAIVMNPPQPGDASYELWVKERDAILQVHYCADLLAEGSSDGGGSHGASRHKWLCVRP